MGKTVFGTGEWAKSNHNIQFGCENNCIYCYARSMCPRHGKTTVEAWKNPVPKPGALEKRFGKRSGTIMFPTTHDITESNIHDCIKALLAMLKAGNQVLVVSKPVPYCIRQICEYCREYKSQILFRFTIGSADDRILKFWEPGAPNFGNRLAALREAYWRGFQTSVSCEPMLDDRIGNVIKAVKAYVTDAVWLGKANLLVERLKMNGEWNDETGAKAKQLTEWQSDDRIKLLYELYKKNDMIKWKESIKKVVGIEVPTEKGLDI